MWKHPNGCCNPAQTASADGSVLLWNSCHISWANTHRSVRKHLPNNSSASIRHQQQRKQGPSAGAQSPGTAALQHKHSPARKQGEQQTQLWRSDGGPGGGGVVGGVSGVRGHPPKLLWAKKTPGTSAVMTVRFHNQSTDVASVLITKFNPTQTWPFSTYRNSQHAPLKYTKGVQGAGPDWLLWTQVRLMTLINHNQGAQV